MKYLFNLIFKIYYKLYDDFIYIFSENKIPLSSYKNDSNFHKIENHIWNLRYINIMLKNGAKDTICKICNIKIYEALYKYEDKFTCNEYIIKKLLE